VPHNTAKEIGQDENWNRVALVLSIAALDRLIARSTHEDEPRRTRSSGVTALLKVRRIPPAPTSVIEREIDPGRPTSYARVRVSS